MPRGQRNEMGVWMTYGSEVNGERWQHRLTHDPRYAALCVSRDRGVWGGSSCAKERSLIFRGDQLGHRARSRVKWGVR